jgi:hypothetical protein
VGIRVPFITGTAASCAAVSGLACLDPGPAVFPHLSARHPVADYLALANAAPGNGLELFALVAFIFFACFLPSAARRARRAGRSSDVSS